ncbi:MAG: hypothetical protein GX045_03305 [Clostridiaceae bacterium]|nr:hypothetical protein [Clostridiaceae bacterium]
MNDIIKFLPFIIPFFVILIVLFIIALRHILTHDTYKHGSRKLWLIIVIVGFQWWGPIAYFIFGKADD